MLYEPIRRRSARYRAAVISLVNDHPLLEIKFSAVYYVIVVSTPFSIHHYCFKILFDYD